MKIKIFKKKLNMIQFLKIIKKWNFFENYKKKKCLKKIKIN